MTPPALPLQQHPYFAAALRQLGRKVSLVDVMDAYPVVAVCVCGQLMASRGPVWRDDLNLAAKSAALQRTTLRLINADDPAGLKAAGYRQLMTAASVATLDLQTSHAARLSLAKGKWRNQWRRAQDAPVTLKHARFDPQEHRWLLQADHAQQRQKRYRALPQDIIHAFSNTHKDAATVSIAYKGGTPVAAMLFLAHRPVVTYHLGWISQVGRAWGLHHRILMAAAEDYAQRGFTRFDLGGVDTDNAPGLARFKIGSGAQVRPLGGTWLRWPGPRGLAAA